MQYLLATLIPLPWLVGDVIAVLLALWALLYLVSRSAHPVPLLLEAFCFVLLYAAVFENFAVVQGWYVYGRSLLMIGDVPLAVPLIEVTVFLLGLELLERAGVPAWARPVIVGFFGMLQDFSLDPVSVKQVFAAGSVTNGRWSWLIGPDVAQMYHIPVYNFPGWMLIMAYAGLYVLLGRWCFARSGNNRIVGVVYPIIALVLALLTMVSPLSQLLLWLAPAFSKGQPIEWGMLAIHLLVPVILLAVTWQRSGRSTPLAAADWALVTIPLLLHVADIAAALGARMTDVLPLVIGASVVHVGLLAVLLLRRAAAIAYAKTRATAVAA